MADSSRLAVENSKNLDQPGTPEDTHSIWAAPAWSSFELSFLTPKLYLSQSTKLFRALNRKQYGLRLSRWLTGQNHSSAESLPLEVWVEILSYLSCLDVLRCRQTSKYMAEISTARPVWTHQYRLLYEFVSSPPGQLRKMYPTSKGLEKAVVGRLKRETLWRASDYPLQRTPYIFLPRPRLTVKVVGGRWLLVLTTDDNRRGKFILLYDMHNPTTCPQKLIDPSECFDNPSSVQSFQVDTYQTEPHLAFHLCATVAMKGKMWPYFGLVVYSVVQSGTGNSARLTPSTVNSFLLPVEGQYSLHIPCVLYGRYYVRGFHPGDTERDMHWLSGRLEIYDWQASNSETHLVAVINLHQDKPIFYRLLPNDQLLIRFRKTIQLFDISVLRSVKSFCMTSLDESLNPSWSDEQYPHSTYGIPVCITSLPALHHPSSSIRIAYCLGTHIHGVIVPSTGHGSPQHIKLSDVDLPQGSVLGIDKFAYPCSSDSLVKGSFTWPGDNPPLQADTQLASPHQVGEVSFCSTLDDLSTTLLILPSDCEVALLYVLL